MPSKVRTKDAAGKGKPPDPAPEQQTPQAPPPTKPDKPKRTASLWDAGTDADPKWVLTVTTWPTLYAAVCDHYHITAVPSPQGKAYRLDKVVDDPNEPVVYVTRLAAKGPSCTCKGWQHHGSCKHVLSLLALTAKGTLDRLPPAPPAGDAWEGEVTP